MRISVYSSKELQGAILALRRLNNETNKEIRQQTREKVLPIWQEAVRSNVMTRLETRVLSDTARVAVSNQNVTLQSATLSKKLSGGLRPSESYPAVEFGAIQDQKAKTYTATSRRGKSYSVTRHTNRQLRPRNNKGYVVYPAAADAIPKIASLWVQTIVRTFYEILER
jgi:hypothetical protein